MRLANLRINRAAEEFDALGEFLATPLSPVTLTALKRGRSGCSMEESKLPFCFTSTFPGNALKARQKVVASFV